MPRPRTMYLDAPIWRELRKLRSLGREPTESDFRKSATSVLKSQSRMTQGAITVDDEGIEGYTRQLRYMYEQSMRHI